MNELQNNQSENISKGAFDNSIALELIEQAKREKELLQWKEKRALKKRMTEVNRSYQKALEDLEKLWNEGERFSKYYRRERRKLERKIDEKRSELDELILQFELPPQGAQ